MNWVVVRGNEKAPVRFCHYWKDRPFKHGCPVPMFLVHRFNTLKSRYATHARVELCEHVEISAYTLCMQSDQAERALGRWEVLLKIETILHRLGWELEREDGASMPRVETQRALDEASRKEVAYQAMLKNQAEGLKRQPAIRAARKAVRGE